MYNLLLVDDEIVVVNGLAYDIDWSGLYIGEIFKACDGAQAIEILRKNRIDIVISDIRMPETDGLELADIIKRQWPGAKVIFMSGHNEFEYAQKALELGVFSYILKPASDEEIMEVVKKAADEIDRELRDLEKQAKTEKRLMEVIPLMMERHLNAWIAEGRSEALNDMEQWIQGMPLCSSTNPACLVLVRIDSIENDLEQDSTSEIIIRNLIRSVLLKDEPGLVFKDTEGNQVIVIYKDNEQELDELRQYIQGSAETFQLSVNRSCGCIVSVFCGELVSAADLNKSYNKITGLMHRSFRFYPGVILGPETTMFKPEGIRPHSLSSNPTFPLLLETLQKDRCLMLIDEIFTEIGQNENIPYEILLEIYFTVGNAIIMDSNKRGIPMVKWSEKENERYFSNFETLKSLDNLKTWCKSSTEKYINCAVNQERGNTHHLVEEAKKFILDNMQKEIFLSDIASRLYVHPNYLCRLFKEDEGCNITDYITKLRIDKAKKLLKESDMKVYEVAENVGYLSVAHFNRTFRRETGMSPKDYQSS